MSVKVKLENVGKSKYRKLSDARDGLWERVGDDDSALLYLRLCETWYYYDQNDRSQELRLMTKGDIEANAHTLLRYLSSSTVKLSF